MTGVPTQPVEDDPYVDLLPLVRRVVAARVRDPQVVDDLVQETLARVMAARARVDPDALAPYAIVTARNLVVSEGTRASRDRRNVHRLVEVTHAPDPQEDVLESEDRSVVGRALARLTPAERELLLAHEVAGAATATLAASLGTTAGAVAAQLARTRAKLRVEYLLASDGPPPDERCRPVLLALSGGDRRRQRELDTAGHLLACDFCAAVSPVLLARQAARDGDADARVVVRADTDVVAARQRAREVAAEAGLRGTALTVVATAVSEVARNIVKFADRGEVSLAVVQEAGRSGIRVTARDRGPGIPDVSEAMADGWSTYGGLGLGLPGARRLMDEFDIASEVGTGTTVTMTKWR